MTRKIAFALAVLLGAGTFAMAQSASPLIKDSSLENCPMGTFPSDWGMQDEDGAQGEVAIDDTQAHTGKRSLLVNKTNSAGYLHNWISVTLKPGAYTLRIWAKAVPAQSFGMQLYDARKWSGSKPASYQMNQYGFMEKKCSPENTEWNKYEMEFDVTETFPVSIQIGLTSKGKLWLDDVEIVPAAK